MYKEKDCMYCINEHTMNCPNSKHCYNNKEKPYFKLDSKYKSKIICKDNVFYNIHHFNRFEKLLVKIRYLGKIKVEDIKEV